MQHSSETYAKWNTANRGRIQSFERVFIIHTYHRTEGLAVNVRESTSGDAVCVSVCVSVIVTVADCAADDAATTADDPVVEPIVESPPPPLLLMLLPPIGGC